MADVKGLLADPEFQKLDAGTQKSVLGRVDPAFSGLSDGDFQSFVQRMNPTPTAQAPAPTPTTYTARSGKTVTMPPADQLQEVQGGPVVPGGLGAIIPMLAGYGGQSVADAMGASPLVSGLTGLVTSVLTGGVGASPKIQAFARGAGRAVPEALAGGSPMMTMTSRAVKAIPSIIKGGTTTAGDWPWIPKALTDMFAEAPQFSGNPETPGLSNVPKPTPPPTDTIDTNSLPFTSSGGPKGYAPPPLPGPEEMAAKLAAQKTNASESSLLDDIAKGQAGKTFDKLTPEQQAGVKRIAATMSPKPVSPPPFASPLESKVIAPSGQAVPTGKIVTGHDTVMSHQEWADAKIKNISDYLKSIGKTPEDLDAMLQSGSIKKGDPLLVNAKEHGLKVGNRVPPTGYSGLDPNSSSHLAIRQRLLDMIEAEKNK